jgi:hypothetical protein
MSTIAVLFIVYSDNDRFRAAEKAATVKSEDEGLSEDEPAPTSDVEKPDDSDGEAKSKPKPKKKKGKGKGKGGVMIPDEWPWEEAKEIFMKPDVLPADQVEVWSGIFYLSCSLTCCVRSSLSGKILM